MSTLLIAPEVQLKGRLVHNANSFNLFLFGIYIWDFFLTFPFEIALGRRRIAFKLTYVPYFLGRYAMLFALSWRAFITMSDREIDCRSMYHVLTIATNVAIGCSSTNLMIRTAVLWKHSLPTLITLVFISLGHWGVLFLGFPVVTSEFGAAGRWKSVGGCETSFVDNRYLLGLFTYTMLYDLLVLGLSIYALAKLKSPSAPLWRRLKRQGIVYFVFAVLAYLNATIFAVVNLRHNGSNAAIVVWSVPAACVSTIASCRAVRSLIDSAPPPSGNTSVTFNEKTNQFTSFDDPMSSNSSMV